ncbi:hypothetical protein EVAR_21866_1 [Eumeta japonica]|uniref:Uncharacterized protein n=1 Tax=Eumeta variegata TaxID=151549 RepID=A0A4C1V7H0_EUMVA|nr:hypothetical protein EVAR_21866_1 [Eumeta japonica]
MKFLVAERNNSFLSVLKGTSTPFTAHTLDIAICKGLNLDPSRPDSAGGGAWGALTIVISNAVTTSETDKLMFCPK